MLHGLRLTAGICAAVLLLVGALVAVRLRGVSEPVSESPVLGGVSCSK
nr:hypothetical protein [Variovorax sp. E3]